LSLFHSFFSSHYMFLPFLIYFHSSIYLLISHLFKYPSVCPPN
jgi:hypothetical protein